MSQTEIPLSNVLNTLVSEVKEWSQSKGWYDREVPIPESIALIHTELSEMMELWRDGWSPRTTFWASQKSGYLKPEGIPSELADVLIRVFDFAGRHGINLHAAYHDKMIYNRKREYRHGGKVG